MKQKGGLPPVFRKQPYTDENFERAHQRIATAMKRSIPPDPQPTRSGLTQLFKRSRSPFTGPGPTTAGRKKYKRNRTRKLRR